MKKLYILSFVLLTSLSFGQAFTGTYDFAGVTNSTGLIDPSPVPTATGVTFGSFIAVNPVATNSTGGGRFSIDNQPLGATHGDNVYANLTGALDPAIYFEVTLTPQSGNNLTLSQITFRSQRSSTGIRTYSVRSSTDGFATNLVASINPANPELSVEANNVFFRVLDAITSGQNGSTITLSGASFTNLTSPITFRFYGWNAEATGGTFSIDDVAFTGSTSTLSVKQNTIAGLNVYVNNKNLYVTSDSNEAKSVEIYNILGKNVINAKVANQAINVSDLASGIYIVKVTENGKSNTLKVAIK